MRNGTMTLYEYMEKSKSDYDVWDDVYDNCVTCGYIEEEEDDYEKFCNAIMKKVKFIKEVDDYSIICDWTKLITDNMEKFKFFTKNNWKKSCQYEDDEDEFIYQWITEINNYMAGYVWDEFYNKLLNFVETLEYNEK